MVSYLKFPGLLSHIRVKLSVLLWHIFLNDLLKITVGWNPYCKTSSAFNTFLHFVLLKNIIKKELSVHFICFVRSGMVTCQGVYGEGRGTQAGVGSLLPPCTGITLRSAASFIYLSIFPAQLDTFLHLSCLILKKIWKILSFITNS